MEKKPKKVKKNKKKKQSNSEKLLDETSDLIAKTPAVNLDYDFVCLDENFSCRDISPEHCKELRDRKFTNKKEDIFLEIRSLEERYKHSINEEKEKWNKKLADVKEKNILIYRTALKNREKELKFEVAELKVEMEENIRALETQEQMVLSQIDMVYKVNKEKIVDDFLAIIGLNF